MNSKIDKPLNSLSTWFFYSCNPHNGRYLLEHFAEDEKKTFAELGRPDELFDGDRNGGALVSHSLPYSASSSACSPCLLFNQPSSRFGLASLDSIVSALPGSHDSLLPQGHPFLSSSALPSCPNYMTQLVTNHTNLITNNFVLPPYSIDGQNVGTSTFPLAGMSFSDSLRNNWYNGQVRDSSFSSKIFSFGAEDLDFLNVRFNEIDEFDSQSIWEDLKVAPFTE